MNIYELIKGRCAEQRVDLMLVWPHDLVDRKTYLPEAKVKLYMYQLCKSIYHMHRQVLLGHKSDHLRCVGCVVEMGSSTEM